MVESLDTVPNCVKEKMHKIAQEKGGSFTKEEQKKALGKSFGMCRSDFIEILDDLSVKAHFRSGRYVSPYERKKNDENGMLGNILGAVIRNLEMDIKKLKKQLSKAFKEKKQESYHKFLDAIHEKEGKIERVKGELRKRGMIDMSNDELRVRINRIEQIIKEKAITNSEEKETIYRLHLMDEMSTGTIKTEEQDLQDALGKIRKKIMDFEMTRMRSDASIFKQGIAKAKENKQRSIFFRAYRPLETLSEVTKTAGKSSSANIAGMEYSEGMLKVTFNWAKRGEVEYGYDVGPDFYDRMAKSQSKGKFLWSELRGKSPGYVIDNPRKMTPGGVGGSIVPYTKITKRAIQGGEFKSLQKQYAKQLKGKVKVVANMPFVRQKQKLISRQSKGFRSKATASDFYWFRISDLSDDVRGCIPTMSLRTDAIPIKGHMRNGKWVNAYDRKGNKAEELKKKIKSQGLQPTPIGEKATEPEKKSKKREPRQISEEKRRKEIDKQARATKATPPPEPREEAIQKLIEETGMERKQAEERIAKLMGLSPEQAKKKAEIKAHEIKFKAQNKELGEKLVALNQINTKLDIIPLKNIISLFVKAFTLMATQRDPEVYLKLFYGHYQKLKRDKKMVVKQKEELLSGIDKIYKELAALSKAKKESGDFEYISAAVDQCAKKAIAKQGGKGSYSSEVANCIRLIGISRRQAGLAPRPQGSQREQRRGARRERAPARRERTEARQREVRVRQSVQRAEQILAREERERIQREESHGRMAGTSLGIIIDKVNEGDFDGAISLLENAQMHIDYMPSGARKDALSQLYEDRKELITVARRRREEQQQRAEAETRRLQERREARELQSQAATRMEQLYGQFERNLNVNLLEPAEASIRLIEGLREALTDEAVKQHWQMRIESMRNSLELQRNLAAQTQDENQHQNAMREARAAEREIRNNNNPQAALQFLNNARDHVNAMIDPEKQRESQRTIDAVQNLIDAHNQEAENELRSFEEEQEAFLEEHAQAVIMSPEVQAARARTRELRRQGTASERVSQNIYDRRNAESNVSGLNEPEGGSVQHIEISQSSSREQYEYELGVFRQLPEGMEVERVGFMRRYSVSSRHYGERYWVHPRLISIGSAPTTRISTRLGRIVSQRPASTIRERSEPALARRRARRKGWKREIKALVEGGMSKSEARRQVIPPKVKWSIRSRGAYASGESLRFRNFKPEKWTSGSTLRLTVKHPDGREAGYASMSYSNVYDPSTGQRHKGIYLGRLFFQPWASGETQGQRRQYRNAPIKELMARVFKLADKHRLWMEGGATPIGVVQGSAAAQRLFNFYEGAGAIARSQYERAGSTSAGFYRPPRGVWAQSTDFVIRIRLKNQEDIFQYTDGNFYYYDRETAMMYKMEFNRAKIIKSKISGKK